MTGLASMFRILTLVLLFQVGDLVVQFLVFLHDFVEAFFHGTDSH